MLEGYEFRVQPISGVDQELVEIGLKYWAAVGIDESGEIIWQVPVKSIDTDGRGSAQIVAAAAVQAVMEYQECDLCGQPLCLTSRTSLTNIINGMSVACVDCSPQLKKRAAALLNSEGTNSRQRREEQQRKQLAQELYAHGLDLWHRHQRNIIATDFPCESISDEIPTAAVEVELATLTLLRFAEQTDPIPAMQQWREPFPFHPGNKTGDLIDEIWKAGLLVPDVSTPAETFIWDPPTYADAWNLAGGDFEELDAPRRTGSYFPNRTILQIPFGPDSDAACKYLDTTLCERLDPQGMTVERQTELLRVIHDVLVHETLRYFISELNKHNLPEVADNHLPRLIATVERLITEYSLGFAYYLAWKAVRTAAASAQKHLRARRQDMSTYALNVLEPVAQQALDNKIATPMEFDEVQDVPLSAMTKILFYSILGMDPMRTSVAAARAALPVPVEIEPSRTSSSSEANSQTNGDDVLEFSGSSPSEVLLKAGTFLAELEKEGQFAMSSIHGEITSVDSHSARCQLRIRIDDEQPQPTKSEVG